MKRLSKGEDKILFGVCSGIAEYFNLDPNLVRLIYVLLALIAPQVFIPLYIIAAIILPEKNEKEKKQSEDTLILTIILMILGLLIIAITILVLSTLVRIS